MPPGNTAYNVSKAAVKALTEGLAHTLHNLPNCKISAHLLIPGFTMDEMRQGGSPPSLPPPGPPSKSRTG
jgi:NAD(P)-dependent dehydrogenase (short-subunit alcohol dehydrogenase family)